MSVKKFIEGTTEEIVGREDLINKGDWFLKWKPDAPDHQTGFELFTPGTFDPDKGVGPLGGMILAAVYFLLEHGDKSFPREIISMANELAGKIKEDEENTNTKPHPTLN